MPDAMQAAGLGATLPLPARNALAELLMDCLAGRVDPGAVESARALLSGEEVRSGGAARAREAVRDGKLSETVDGEDTVVRRLEGYRGVLDAVPTGTSLEVRLDQARALFRAELYFEVHEVLEPAWLRAEGVEKAWLQGVIQAAVARHHYVAGNLSGARSLSVAAAEKLAEAPSSWHAFPLAEVGAASRAWAAWLARGAQAPEPGRPRLDGAGR